MFFSATTSLQNAIVLFICMWLLTLAIFLFIRGTSRNPDQRHTRDLRIENLALRHQLQAMRAQHPQRYEATPAIRSFWLLMCRFYRNWQRCLVMFEPDTIKRWHALGWRVYWRHKSKPGEGRPKTDGEVRELVRRMARENTNWGAPRIHGELRMLGFDISERTVSRLMPKGPPNPDLIRKWKAFLKSHSHDIAAMDFFTVPTLCFRVLYVLVIMRHHRRQIVHVNVTANPTTEWVKRQIKEAFPFDEAPRYLIHDRGSVFSKSLNRFLRRAMHIKPVITSFRSPWQNGICERFIGSVRRDLTAHVIALNEDHLRQLLRDYLAYYHHDRTHLGLDKNTPKGRLPQPRPSPKGKLKTIPKIGGLHHRYEWRNAA